MQANDTETKIVNNEKIANERAAFEVSGFSSKSHTLCLKVFCTTSVQLSLSVFSSSNGLPSFCFKN